jgi:hypothetical protein
MKRIVLGLSLFASVSMAETPRELGHNILLNAKNIYKIKWSKGYCERITKSNAPDGVLNIWKNGGLVAAGFDIPYSFLVIDLKQYTRGNGKYMLLSGVEGWSAYIVDNKSWCDKLASGNAYTLVGNMLKEDYGPSARLIK